MPAGLHFMASHRPAARGLAEDLIARYGQTDLALASCVVAIGGDGTTLKALAAIWDTPETSVFAMRIPGSVGALGNQAALDHLPERIASADRLRVAPLTVRATLGSGAVETVVGFNEATVVRQQFQAARLRVRLQPAAEPLILFGDGLVISTPLGSTGYCRSLGGAQIEVGSGLLSLAGMALRIPSGGFRAVVKDDATIGIEVLDPVYRPVRIETHTATLEQAISLEIRCSDRHVILLQDREEQSRRVKPAS